MPRIKINKSKDEDNRIVDAIADTMDDSQVRLIGTGKYDYIDIKDIRPDPEQVRKLGIPENVLRGEVSKALSSKQQGILDDIDDLANNIDKNGLINPIMVYQKGAYYRILAGERRYWAHVRKNLVQIQAIVRTKPKSEDERIVLQLSENLLRSDLSLLEYVKGIHDFGRSYKEAQGSHPGYKEFATNFGFGRTHCYLLSSIAKLSKSAIEPMVAQIKNGKIRELKQVGKYASLGSSNDRSEFIKELSSSNESKRPLSGLTIKVDDYKHLVKVLSDLKKTGAKKYDFDEDELKSIKGVRKICEKLFRSGGE